MDIPNAKYLCLVEYDGKRRSQKQQDAKFYPGNKCMGCYTCYARNTDGGLGTHPMYLGKPIIPGRELVTNSMDAFLSEDLALILERIVNPLNLITKNPYIAFRSLKKYPEIWRKLDYHIQVTTLKEGQIMDQPSLSKLVKEAKSMSCRVDPIIPGVTKDDDVIRHLKHLRKIGVRHVTSNTLKIYSWQRYSGDVMKFYSDGEYVARGKATIMIDRDEEERIFRMLRKATDNLGMTLGVCMSRPEVQELATAPCEGGVYIGQYGRSL